MDKVVNAGGIMLSNSYAANYILGPCVIESKRHAMFMAKEIDRITDELGLPFIYKASWDKANRTSGDSFRGKGMEYGLDVLKCIKDKYNCPIITDVHSPEQVKFVSQVADIIQIPAFLCRQTDLLTAAGESGKPVMVKKGQFLDPESVIHIIEKIRETKNDNCIICERGTSFGYKTLVNDMGGLHVMKQFGQPIIFDATHSVQKISAGKISGGNRELVPYLARAAIAVGVAGVFMEVHDNPDCAPSDGPNMLKLCDLQRVLTELQAIDTLVKFTFNSIDNPSD